MIILRKSIFVFLFAFFFIFQNTDVHANFDSVKIIPVFPENQKPNVFNYFSLNMTEEMETVELEVDIINPNDSPLTVSVTSGDAITSSEGNIVIVKDVGQTQNSFTNQEYDMSENILIKEDTISLKPNESKRIKLSVVTPESKVGTYISGILFSTFEDGEVKKVEVKEEKGSATFKVNSRFEITYAIELNYPKTEKIEADINVENGILFSKFDKANASFNLINENADISRLEKFTVQIKDKDSVIGEQSKELVKVTPMTKMNVEIPLTRTPDSDTLTGYVKYMIGDKEHTKELTFKAATKKSQISKDVERIDVDLLNNQNNNYWIYAGVFLLLITTYAGYWLGKRKNK